MDRVYRRLSGLLKVAQKREQSENYIDKLVGRQVARNLNMVFRILHEEIGQCKDCKHMLDLAEVTDGHREGCCCNKLGHITVPEGFCHEWADKRIYGEDVGK